MGGKFYPPAMHIWLATLAGAWVNPVNIVLCECNVPKILSISLLICNDIYISFNFWLNVVKHTKNVKCVLTKTCMHFIMNHSSCRHITHPDKLE